MPVVPGRYESFTTNAAMFLGRNRAMTIDSSETGDIIIMFDLLLAEKHKWEIKATTHPVEDGSPFTDHIQQKIRKGSIEGYITNFGLQRGELFSNSAQEVFDELEYYKDNAEPVNIVTTLKYYENYIITSVEAKRDGKTGEAQGFMINFQEFRTVQLKEVNIEATQIKRPKTKDLKKDKDKQRVSPNANAGEQRPGRVLSAFSFPEYLGAPLKSFGGP